MRVKGVLPTVFILKIEIKAGNLLLFIRMCYQMVTSEIRK